MSTLLNFKAAQQAEIRLAHYPRVSAATVAPRGNEQGTIRAQLAAPYYIVVLLL